MSEVRSFFQVARSESIAGRSCSSLMTKAIVASCEPAENTESLSCEYAESALFESRALLVVVA